MSTFDSCTKCTGSKSIVLDRMPDCHQVSWAWMTSELNVALISKLCWPLMCLVYFFWHDLSMGVCTTRHCQTCGQLVQELNACTIVEGGGNNHYWPQQGIGKSFGIYLPCEGKADTRHLRMKTVWYLLANFPKLAVLNLTKLVPSWKAGSIIKLSERYCIIKEILILYRFVKKIKVANPYMLGK